MTHVLKTKKGNKVEVTMWCSYQAPEGSEQRCCGRYSCRGCSHGMATMSIDDIYKLLEETEATRA